MILTPPVFIAWMLGIRTVVGAAVLMFTPWPLGLVACVLLLLGARRAARLHNPEPQAGLGRA